MIYIFLYSEHHQEHAHSAVHAHNPNKVSSKNKSGPQKDDTKDAQGIC